jgi:hypothetical protein
MDAAKITYNDVPADSARARANEIKLGNSRPARTARDGESCGGGERSPFASGIGMVVG